MSTTATCDDALAVLQPAWDVWLLFYFLWLAAAQTCGAHKKAQSCVSTFRQLLCIAVRVAFTLDAWLDCMCCRPKKAWSSHWRTAACWFWMPQLTHPPWRMGLTASSTPRWPSSRAAQRCQAASAAGVTCGAWPMELLAKALDGVASCMPLASLPMLCTLHKKGVAG